MKKDSELNRRDLFEEALNIIEENVNKLEFDDIYHSAEISALFLRSSATNLRMYRTQKGEESLKESLKV